MKIGNVSSLNDGLAQLAQLRLYKPFKYSGKFFCFYHDRTVYCYRSKKPIERFMQNQKISSIDIATVSSK